MTLEGIAVDPVTEHALEKLQALIARSRVHMYKPIQVAEVLYHHRTDKTQIIDPLDRNTYRKQSKRWRDAVSLELLNSRSSSSAKYQDALWDETEIPPNVLMALATCNVEHDGAVEQYIYRKFAESMEAVSVLLASIDIDDPASFDVNGALEYFESSEPLRRSVDKVYEVIVYAVLQTAVSAVGSTVTVTFDGESSLAAALSPLLERVMGVSLPAGARSVPAEFFRAGVTNAADRGLDMWGNFGPAVQVKHRDLSIEMARDITQGLDTSQVIIVCRGASDDAVMDVLTDPLLAPKVRAVITEDDIVNAYESMLRGEASHLGGPLLSRLKESLLAEFPQSQTLSHFLESRGYTIE